MKKWIASIAVLLAVTTLTSCQLLLPDLSDYPSFSWGDFYEEFSSKPWGKPDSSSNGSTSDSPSSSSSTSSNAGTSSDAEEEVNELTFTKKQFGNYLKKDGPLTQEGLPSLGNPKMLVIPINLRTKNATTTILKDVQTAFCGTSAETGWESVESYYKKSSYGKLDLDCDVMQSWFTPKYSASYYNAYYDEYTGANGSTLILREALAYYESKLDLTEYDYDKDGYIDSVWLIYNCAVDYESDDSIYWAFMNWEYDDRKYDGVKAYNYAFAGTDFMYEELDPHASKPIKVNAHTYIHETGHLMGLDDYYDYDEETGPSGGTYCADMMDDSIGDHGVISKMLLGWVTPTIVTGSGVGEYTLSSFTKTGEFLLISDHEITSIYDEYFLVEFYTNEGLNENDRPILNDGYEVAEGIRIMHVDARIYYNKEGKVDVNPGDAYTTGFLYDNSDTSKKFLDNLRADYGKEMREYLYPESLYTANGVVFGRDIWATHRYHSGTALNFRLEVKSIANGNCTVKITK